MNENVNAKLDLLQQTVDLAQEKYMKRITELEKLNADLKAIIEAGGTNEQFQKIADRLDVIITDVQEGAPKEVLAGLTADANKPENANKNVGKGK